MKCLICGKAHLTTECPDRSKGPGEASASAYAGYLNFTGMVLAESTTENGNRTCRNCESCGNTITDMRKLQQCMRCGRWTCQRCHFPRHICRICREAENSDDEDEAVDLPLVLGLDDVLIGFNLDDMKGKVIIDCGANRTVACVELVAEY